MAHSNDTAIIGGGLNGGTLALALAQAGLNVTIIDRLSVAARQSRDFDGRGYALSHASKRLLNVLDLWANLRDQAQPILHISVTDGLAGEGPSPLMLDFDHAEIEEGPMGFMIEDRHLRMALLNAIESHPRITHIDGQNVVSHQIDETGATVGLADGRTCTAQILIGADGPHSPTAARAGIRRTGWDYDQCGLVCAIAHERPHDGTAHQFFMPSGPLAILPLAGNRSSIVWTESTANAATISAMGDCEYMQTLRPRIGDFLGRVELCGTRFSYPLGLSLANRVAAPRLALIGDAAHRMHPIAGQGLNAGLKDVGTLAEVLVQAHRRGEDIGRQDVLDRYQSWRRFDTATLALATDTFNRLFSNDNPFLRLTRDLGLAATNALPGLRRALIREAAGLSGELPRLLQGENI